MATTSQFSNTTVNHNKQNNFYNLLSCGSIVPEIHYDPFAINWWTTPTQKNRALPYRIGMKVQVELANIIYKIFLIHKCQLLIKLVIFVNN